MSDPSGFSPAIEEHPFAQFVRILGKGKSGSRSLDQAEACAAFEMILRGEAEQLQLGAFLMLLRVKEETPEELAGFVKACRANMVQPPAGLSADLDWSSYAGKKHQHPWFLLAVLLLAQAGYRVLLHGCDGHTEGRLYTEQAMVQLGLPVADNWVQVEQQLGAYGLSYLPLRTLCPALHELMQLRPLLGLRSPVNTLARLLNPLLAECSLQSVFHPAYGQLHQEADLLLGQPRAMVFKGDSGEVEIKPQADTRLNWLVHGVEHDGLMRRRIQGRVPSVVTPAAQPLASLWRGTSTDGYGLEAVLGTTAAALLLLDVETTPAAAHKKAGALWHERNRENMAPCR